MNIAFASVLILISIVAYCFSWKAADDSELGFMGLLHAIFGITGAAGVLEIVMPHSGFGFVIGVIFSLLAVAALILSTVPFSKRDADGKLRRTDKLQFAGLAALGLLFAAGCVLQFAFVV